MVRTWFLSDSAIFPMGVHGDIVTSLQLLQSKEDPLPLFPYLELCHQWQKERAETRIEHT